MKLKIAYIIPVILFVLDQLTKFIFQYRNLVLIPYILSIKYSENPGIIFGWFSNNLIFIYLIPTFIILFFFYYSFKHKEYRLGSLFIIFGLLGNMITRIFYGYVIDFILIPIYPERNISNFNFADASLIIGIILLIYYELKNK